MIHRAIFLADGSSDEPLGEHLEILCARRNLAVRVTTPDLRLLTAPTRTPSRRPSAGHPGTRRRSGHPLRTSRCRGTGPGAAICRGYPGGCSDQRGSAGCGRRPSSNDRGLAAPGRAGHPRRRRAPQLNGGSRSPSDIGSRGSAGSKVRSRACSRCGLGTRRPEAGSIQATLRAASSNPPAEVGHRRPRPPTQGLAGARIGARRPSGPTRGSRFGLSRRAACGLTYFGNRSTPIDGMRTPLSAPLSPSGESNPGPIHYE